MGCRNSQFFLEIEHYKKAIGYSIPGSDMPTAMLKYRKAWYPLTGSPGSDTPFASQHCKKATESADWPIQHEQDMTQYATDKTARQEC